MSTAKKICTHICVHCMDFRTQGVVDSILEMIGVKWSHALGTNGSFDRISIQGGAANFEQLEAHLASSKRLHESSVAILMVHENCGAGATRDDLQKAAKIAVRLGFRVRLFYIRLDNGWDEIMAG